MEKKIIIYRVWFASSSKSYVGITGGTLKRRLSEHVRQANRGSSHHFHRAIRKYGIDEMCSEELAIVDSVAEGYALEKKFIADYKSFGQTGYNMTEGGQGSFGSTRPKDESWRLAQSSRMAGSNNPNFGCSLSEDTRNKISAGLKNHFSDSSNLRVGTKNPQYGIPQTAERKAQQAAAIRRAWDEGRYSSLGEITRARNKKEWIVVSPNGQVEQIDNLKQFCEAHMLSYSTMLRSAYEQKTTHKGWKVREFVK